MIKLYKKTIVSIFDTIKNSNILKSKAIPIMILTAALIAIIRYISKIKIKVTLDHDLGDGVAKSVHSTETKMIANALLDEEFITDSLNTSTMLQGDLPSYMWTIKTKDNCRFIVATSSNRLDLLKRQELSMQRQNIVKAAGSEFCVYGDSWILEGDISQTTGPTSVMIEDRVGVLNSFYLGYADYILNPKLYENVVVDSVKFFYAFSPKNMVGEYAPEGTKRINTGYKKRMKNNFKEENSSDDTYPDLRFFGSSRIDDSPRGKKLVVTFVEDGSGCTTETISDKYMDLFIMWPDSFRCLVSEIEKMENVKLDKVTIDFFKYVSESTIRTSFGESGKVLSTEGGETRTDLIESVMKVFRSMGDMFFPTKS
ncbi:MAG: hypothetical protein KAH32_05325 [Chlamydiia bacterium]|nr:hypothetical protein [Chlamydiia bacterium]